MVISIFWYIALIIVFIATFSLTLWLIIEFYRDKKEGKDDPIAINFCSHLPGAEGRFIGTEQKVEIGKGGRYVIDFMPGDIRHDFKGEVKSVPVVVGSNKRIVLPRGHPSRDRNILFYLPPEAENIPNELKDTLIGKSLMWAVELQNYEKTVIDILREGGERKDLLLKKLGDGEISKEFINFQEGLVSDYLQRIVNPREAKDKVASINLTGGGSSSAAL